MKISNLIDKLKERPRTLDAQQIQQKEEWLGAIDSLFKGIEEWLAPAVQEGVLTTSRSAEGIVEQYLGEYQAPVLRIDDGRATVRLQPVGGRVVGLVEPHMHGLRGRVDLICGPFKIPLVRDSTGNWLALPLRGEPVELTEETFTEILSEILLDD